MRVLGAFPDGTVGNCDFVDRSRTSVAPGQRVIDLQVDLDNLPGWGLLCLHEETVDSMVKALGWSLYDGHDAATVLDLVAECVALREENGALRRALEVVAKKPSTVPVTPTSHPELVEVS